MTKDEALDLALKALTPFSTPNWAGTGVDKANEAITAIKQARSAPVQEPKFWYDQEEGLLHDHFDDSPFGCIPLYTTPPAAQQEPVAYRSRMRNRDGQVITGWVVHTDTSENPDPRIEIEPLYTTPPTSQKEPDYKALWQQMCERCDELDKRLATNKALDKKAENARELGLDYEPVAWTVSGKITDWSKDFSAYQTKHYTRPVYTPPAAPVQEPVAIDGNTSDGYHTFNELYEFRKAYNAALFNEWAAGGKCSVHKSWRHHDGELCFGGGWFIVVAVLPDGQISNHYEAKDWDLFAVPETERALFEFDGHTGADVVERLKTYTTPPAQPAPVQEPVAWMDVDENGAMSSLRYWSEPDNRNEVALYPAPPAQRQWVGLMRGVRVEGDTVVITAKGGNDAAQKLCAALIQEKNT